MYFLRLDLRGGWARLPIGSTLVIGRSNTADLILDSPTISRVHCRLKVQGEALTVEDMGSQTGTQRNGARVEAPTPLVVGDMLQLGTFTLIIEDEARQALARKKQALTPQATADDISPADVELKTQERAAARQLLAPLAEASSPKPSGALSALTTADDIPPPSFEAARRDAPDPALDTKATTEDFVPPPISGETPVEPAPGAEPIKARLTPASTIIVDEAALYDKDKS